MVQQQPYFNISFRFEHPKPFLLNFLGISPTIFTVMASKSGNTQTLVISVCETSLAGCVFLAKFLRTSILKSRENKKYLVTIWRDLSF